VRRATLKGLAQSCEDETDRKLLFNQFVPFHEAIDPKSPITADRIAAVARQLKKPREEIQQRYAVLAERFGLILES